MRLRPLKRLLLLFLITAILMVVVIFYVTRPLPAPSKLNPPALPESAPLSMLAASPDWSSLEIYQNSITPKEFLQLLTTVFTTGNAWQTWIQIDEAEARIQTGNSAPNTTFHLRFAQPETRITAPRYWRTPNELPPPNPGKILAGLKIAIDPGHLGGAWAKMEERWFVIGSETPVEEGTMTLQVAQLLKPRLEALGATVTLVRQTLEPVTPIRPADLLSLAQQTPAAGSPQKLAERLFYRTAEIRARADRVNQILKPDLVLCLHFNAEAWGYPQQPLLTDRSHLHLILNGAYTDEELLLADQRFALLQKLLQRTHQQEAQVGASVAATFAEISDLPAYTYPPESTNVRPIAAQPYLWVRNLLANRLYQCPVIFMEPYVMNSTSDYPRIQAGDYPGLRQIQGKPQASIFREYADAVTQGLINYYSAARPLPH